MRKTMVNDRQSDREGFRERRPIMRANIMRNGAAALLFLGLFVFHSGPAQALPNNHPDKCSPGYDSTPEAKQCLSVLNPGQIQPLLLCTNDGDTMCCWKNVSGGYDCHQINALTQSQSGGKRLPGGKLKMAPGTSSPDTGTVKPPVVPETKSPIMRRGIEGEQPAEPTPGTPTAPEQPTGK